MKDNFLKPLFKENPVLVLTLGMCPTLAVTTTLENGYVMGLAVILILFLTSIIITLIRPLVTDNIRIPAYIVIIATLVTTLEILVKRFLPEVDSVFGIYLPLIVVNCIILGSALNFGKEKNILKNISSSLGIGLGFTISLTLLGLIRELLGNNSITLIKNLTDLVGYRAVYENIFKTDYLPIKMFITPAGAFLALAILIALTKYIKDKRSDKNESN